MSTVTIESASFRRALEQNRDAVFAILAHYGATNPRLFGSVARGDASATSDVDLLVDLLPDSRKPLLRVAGIGEELLDLLGVHVDVVADELLRDGVSVNAHAEAIPL